MECKNKDCQISADNKDVFELFKELANSDCKAIASLAENGFIFPDYQKYLGITNTEYLFNQENDQYSTEAINIIYQNLGDSEYINNDIKYFLRLSNDTKRIFELNFILNDELFRLLIAHIYHHLSNLIIFYQNKINDENILPVLITEKCDSIEASILLEIKYYRDNIIYPGIKSHTNDHDTYQKYYNTLENIFNEYEKNNLKLQLN